MDPYRREKVENWVGDFCESTAFARHPAAVREHGPTVLTEFLVAACAGRDVGPDEIEVADMKPALVDGVGRLDLPDPVRAGVPALCADFVDDLETAGRLGGGRVLAGYLRALSAAYLDATSDRPKPVTRPAAKIRRNDPCPCGSGKKYKKCCQRLG